MSTAILPPVPAAPATPPSAVPPTPRAAAPATGPVPRRWTLTEYRKLADAGLLDGMNTILIDGEVLVMPNPKPPHDTALTKTYRFLERVCPAGHYVRNQQSFDVGTANDPGPDLAIVPGSEDDYDTLPPTAALLIAEIGSSSLALDPTTKAELYATAGVPEYWVVDVEHRQLVVFRDPHPLPAGLGAVAYRTHTTLGPTDSVAPHFAPNSSVLVSDLLPR